jgi:hypothetical protein
MARRQGGQSVFRLNLADHIDCRLELLFKKREVGDELQL